MTTLATMPSLSTDGWVNSSMKTADYLFSHFFATDYSQSYSLSGTITSFAHILHTNQGDISKTITDTENALANYFGRYFKDVVTQVDDKATAANSSSVALNLFMNFTDNDGVTHSLGKMIEYTNTTISRVIAINNG